MTIQLVRQFDIWQPGYAGASVDIYEPGTTTRKTVYGDINGLTTLANPQTLENLGDENDSGKFLAPCYVDGAYELFINSRDRTGRMPAPITTLVGEDASEATVTAASGSVARDLEDILDDSIWAENYGALGSSSSTNTATLTAAVGEAAARGGGAVNLPPGTYPITSLSLPADVVLRGAGHTVTVVQSQLAGTVLTLAGDRAGIEDLTVDGIDLQAGSIGVYAVGIESPVFKHAIVKRFVTGAHFKGITKAEIDDLSVLECTTNVKWHGDTDAGGTAAGTAAEHNEWHRGSISDATGTGLDLSYEDAEVIQNLFRDLSITGNAVGVHINGARFTTFDGVRMSTNTKNFDVEDDAAVDVKNFVQNLRVRSGHINGGECEFTGTVESVVFEEVELENVDFTATVPIDNAVLLLDCVEDADVTLGGDTTKFIRAFTANRGYTVGATTNNSATKAWAITLEPGERAILEALVIGNQRNGTNDAAYRITSHVRRAPADLAYDGQTANFTLGAVLTGATSGATARIVADSDGGTTGTLSLRSIVGEFIENEAITDSSGGAAVANGVLSVPACTVVASGATVTSETNANWACAFAANGADVELRVTGDTSQTVDWKVDVSVIRGG